jgi:hypothetical protein
MTNPAHDLNDSSSTVDVGYTELPDVVLRRPSIRDKFPPHREEADDFLLYY